MKKSGFFLFFVSCYLGIWALESEVQLSIESPICQALNNVIELPVFSEGATVEGSAAEIVEMVRPILRKRLAAARYDRMFPVLQFLDHYDDCKMKDENISAIEAFKTFEFIPWCPQFEGGPCVSLTLDLCRHLPDSLKGYVVAAKLPGRFHQFGFPKYCHTAVLIRYADPSSKETGYVLLDPSFDISEPILLKEGGEPFFYELDEKGIWKFYLDEDKIICDINPFEDQEKNQKPADYFQGVYFTTSLSNPIKSSAVPMILVDRRYSFLCRKEDGTQIAHLNIELDKQRVIWNQGHIKYDPIPFNQLLSGDILFPEWFASNLLLSQNELNWKILRIIKNKNVLDSLYRDYLLLLKDTQDFALTGPLDLLMLEERVLK